MAGFLPVPGTRERRYPLPRLHIDMTPMVDLAFLLLTFFVLTAHLIDQRMMDLALPLPGPPSPASNMLTLLLDESGATYAYRGPFDPATTRLLRLREKELPIVLRSFTGEQASGPPVCTVKAGSGARYGRVVDVLDEVGRAGIARLSVEDSMNTAERELIRISRH